MSRGMQSSDPFYRKLDEATAIGPGVREILSTPIKWDDSSLTKLEPTDEDYVRSKWTNIGEYGYGGRTRYIYLADAKREFSAQTESEAWAEVAKFTRQREEEIRQLQEEMWMVEVARTNARGKLNDEQAEMLVYVDTVFYARWCRVLERLQGELSRLTKGMK